MTKTTETKLIETAFDSLNSLLKIGLIDDATYNSLFDTVFGNLVNKAIDSGEEAETLTLIETVAYFREGANKKQGA